MERMFYDGWIWVTLIAEIENIRISGKRSFTCGKILNVNRFVNFKCVI